MVLRGSLASEAARPMISKPAYAKTTSNILPAMPLIPPGMIDSLANSPAPIALAPGKRPAINTMAVRIKNTMANIFTPDSPLTIFPNLSAPSKLTSVTPIMRIVPKKAIDKWGNHSRSKMVIAVASLDIDNTVPVQYNQPTTKPNPGPSSRAAKLLKEPTVGFATIISDNAYRIKYTRTPAKI